MTSTQTRCAVYLRISLDRTGDRLAVDRQREDCEKIAAARGWQIVREDVDNSVSAYAREKVRPEYDRMVTDFKAGAFAAIVCWELDRRTRQPRQLEDWIEWAEGGGLRLVTANGEAVSPRTAVGCTPGSRQLHPAPKSSARPNVSAEHCASAPTTAGPRSGCG